LKFIAKISVRLEFRRASAYVWRVRRPAKPLIFLLIAVQLLLVVPAISAASVSTAGAMEMPCDGMPMHESVDGDDPCPCCPDGASSMTDCLASCMLAAVAAPAITSTQFVTSHAPPYVETPFTADSFSSPPLNPPPIG
jgi:hypothetical protein